MPNLQPHQPRGGRRLNRPTRLAPRAILLATLLTLAATTALADHYTDDAASGRDAGDTQAQAMAISYGSNRGYLSPRDHDWFRVEEGTALPRCVEVTASGDNNSTVRLTLESPDRTRSLKGKFPTGGSRTLAIAAPALSRAYFDITASANEPGSGDPARPGHYEFTLRSTGVPAPSVGDALSGGDAGNERETATATPGPCFGGRVDPLRQMGDLRDVYRFSGAKDQVLTYGFATTASDPGAVMLAVLDAEGNQVGVPLRSGEYAQVALPSTGTFYLSAASVGVPTENVGYVISHVLGPPDPGNGCRPQC